MRCAKMAVLIKFELNWIVLINDNYMDNYLKEIMGKIWRLYTMARV